MKKEILKLLAASSVAAVLVTQPSSEFDCVATAVNKNFTVVVCDRPNPRCATKDTADCSHTEYEVPKANWPEAWGERVSGRLLSAQYVDGQFRPMYNCTAEDMEQRRLQAITERSYDRKPVNRNPGMGSDCGRRTSDFIERLLGQ